MMKQLLLFSIIVTFIFLSSCKGDKNEKSVDKHFKFSFELKVNQPDSLQFYYIDDSIPNFNEDKSIWLSVKGDSLPQLISFDVPSNVSPDFIRLDFNNKDQQDFKLKNFKVEYDTLVYFANDEIIPSLFLTNDGIVYSDSTKVYSIARDVEKFDPFIYSTVILKEKLNSFSK